MTDGSTPAPTGGPEKRRVILDAAVRVFATRGYHTSRVGDIAEEQVAPIVLDGKELFVGLDVFRNHVPDSWYQ